MIALDYGYIEKVPWFRVKPWDWLVEIKKCRKFDYHIKLHYSQTVGALINVTLEFDYHIKLHYSQTHYTRTEDDYLFDYHIKLHYSQTIENDNN